MASRVPGGVVGTRVWWVPDMVRTLVPARGTGPGASPSGSLTTFLGKTKEIAENHEILGKS